MKKKTATTTKAATKTKTTAKAKAKPKAKSGKNLMAEVMEKKLAEQKTGGKHTSFDKFKPGKSRNENNSNVGPSWGGRKGN